MNKLGFGKKSKGIMDKGAVISPCRRWRYALWQYWSVDGKILW